MALLSMSGTYSGYMYIIGGSKEYSPSVGFHAAPTPYSSCSSTEVVAPRESDASFVSSFHPSRWQVPELREGTCESSLADERGFAEFWGSI